jgi:hypothetical protein
MKSNYTITNFYRFQALLQQQGKCEFVWLNIFNVTKEIRGTGLISIYLPNMINKYV